MPCPFYTKLSGDLLRNGRMDIIPLTCTSCGATVKAKPGAQEARCQFCNATQPILQLPSRALAPLSADDHVMLIVAEDATRQLEHQLARCDQAWRKTRINFVVTAPFISREASFSGSMKSAVTAGFFIASGIAIANVLPVITLLCFLGGGLFIRAIGAEGLLAIRRQRSLAAYTEQRAELNRRLLLQRKQLAEMSGD